MHAAGFNNICDVDYVQGYELVASKCRDGTLWWRNVETEGSGFTQLFKGSIKSLGQNGQI